MPRNLERRVEILYPIESEKLKNKIIHILDIELKDNVKAHELTFDGTYVKPINKKAKKIDSQAIFAKEAKEEADSFEEEDITDFRKTRRFIVETHV